MPNRADVGQVNPFSQFTKVDGGTNRRYLARKHRSAQGVKHFSCFTY